MSTNQDANNKGFITPAGTDLINNGDDAISANARATVDLYGGLDTRLTTVEARREYIIQGQYVTDVAAAADAAADADGRAAAAQSAATAATQQATQSHADAAAAAASAAAAATDAGKVDAAIDTQDSAMAQVVADNTTPSQTRALLDGLYRSADIPDTPWIGLDYAPGFTGGGTPGTLAYRVRDGVVYFRGGANGTFPERSYTRVTVVGAIPAYARPGITTRGGAGCTYAQPAFFEINSAGHINLGWSSLANTPSWIAFTASYPL